MTRDAAMSPIHFLERPDDLDLIPTRHSARHDIALSPVRFPSPQRSRKSCQSPAGGSGGGSRQVPALKKRLAALQQQVNILRTSKENALRGQGELKQLVEQLQADLAGANQKLQSQRLTSQVGGFSMKNCYNVLLKVCLVLFSCTTLLSNSTCAYQKTLQVQWSPSGKTPL